MPALWGGGAIAAQTSVANGAAAFRNRLTM